MFTAAGLARALTGALLVVAAVALLIAGVLTTVQATIAIVVGYALLLTSLLRPESEREDARPR